ncbi:MAG: hypothetical protein HRU28_15595 [Rhizobiales bacterium]|nr:hypothetical protein [Hyphomicrobiales bacterium]
MSNRENENQEIDVSMLSDELKKQVPFLTVNRIGTTDTAFMRTECYLGYVKPEENYILQFDGIHKDENVSIKPLAIPKKPAMSVLAGEWQEKIEFVIDDANILGGNGRYILPTGDDVLSISIATTSAETLAYYGCHLVKVGEGIKFGSSGDLPVTVTTVGANYPDGYLLNPKLGGGAYLEVHDRPHFHMPLDPSCEGYLIIGKRTKEGADEVSAFKIPYGYGVHMAPWCIHSDAYLVGKYMVIYSVTPEFSTVILYKSTGDLAKVKFVG